MDAKLDKISELSNILCEKESLGQKIVAVSHDFEQIIDDRYNRKALILASQLPIKDWYNVFKSELIAEACLDRIHISELIIIDNTLSYIL